MIVGFEGWKENITEMLHLTVTLRDLRRQIPAAHYFEFLATLHVHNPSLIVQNAKMLVERIKGRWEIKKRGLDLLIDLLEDVDHEFGTNEKSNFRYVNFMY